MAEKIKTGDTYYKEVRVTTKNEDMEDEPVSLEIFDDNYFVIKKNPSDPDEEAFIFKKAPIKGDPEDGTLIINLTPQETANLPISDEDTPYLMAYVQIGSTITGEVHEVSTFKVKVQQGGVHYITPLDTSFDMGRITEPVGYIFDAGPLCEQVTMTIELDPYNIGRIVINSGALNDPDVTIHDAGNLTDIDTTFVDLGYLKECQ